MLKPRFASLLIVAIIFFLTSSCGPQTAIPSTPTALPPTPTGIPAVATQPANTALQQYYVPPYFLPSYAEIIEGSKTEQELVIYSVMSNTNWAPILETFKSHYPWIRVKTVELGTSEVFDRYLQESASGQPTADLIISTDIIGWQNFINAGEVLTYRSQEETFLPLWSTTNIGVYVVSSDPMLIIYNKELVPVPPISLGQLISFVNNQEGFKQQIVTYDAETNATGFSINWAFVKHFGEPGWEKLTNLGYQQPILTPDRNRMVRMVNEGSAKLGYFVTSIVVFPNLDTYTNLGYKYMQDGQPVLLRYMAITQSGANKNSAKLLLDFLLSQEGQLAIDRGGLTPYRTDIANLAQYHLDKISQQVGDENLIFIDLDPTIMNVENRQTFLDRWKLVLNKQEPTPQP